MACVTCPHAKKLLDELAVSLKAWREHYVFARESLELHERHFTEHDAKVYASRMLDREGKREPDIIRLEYFAHVRVERSE